VWAHPDRSVALQRGRRRVLTLVGDGTRHAGGDDDATGNVSLFHLLCDSLDGQEGAWMIAGDEREIVNRDRMIRLRYEGRAYAPPTGHVDIHHLPELLDRIL
jgi:hypothetical protein